MSGKKRVFVPVVHEPFPGAVRAATREQAWRELELWLANQVELVEQRAEDVCADCHVCGSAGRARFSDGDVAGGACPCGAVVEDSDGVFLSVVRSGDPDYPYLVVASVGGRRVPVAKFAEKRWARGFRDVVEDWLPRDTEEFFT